MLEDDAEIFARMRSRVFYVNDELFASHLCYLCCYAGLRAATGIGIIVPYSRGIFILDTAAYARFTGLGKDLVEDFVGGQGYFRKISQKESRLVSIPDGYECYRLVDRRFDVVKFCDVYNKHTPGVDPAEFNLWGVKYMTVRYITGKDSRPGN